MLIHQILENKGTSICEVPRETTVGEIVRILADKRIGAVLVTEQDHSLAGILSERDVIAHLGHHGAGALELRAEEIMTQQVVTCTAECDLDHALAEMSRHGIRHIPIVRGEALVGIISARDVLDAQREILIASIEETETALDQSEARFRDFATSASDYFWEMDENLRFSYFSDRFSEITGVAESQLLGKTRQETGIPNVDDAAWQQHLADLAAHRPFRAFVHPRPNERGEDSWFSISGTPIFDGDDTFKGYRGTGSDITQQTCTESLLRESEQRLKAIMDHVPAALFLKDPDARYLLINRQFEDWFGVESADAAGKTAHDLFPKERADRYAKGDRKILGNWQVTTDEVVIPRQSGELRDFMLTKFPIFDAGQPTGFGGVMIDVTERKTAEEALRVSNERLETHHLRLEQELRTGRDMQSALLPTGPQFRSIEETYLCRVESHFETSSELGGDIWGLREIDDHRFGIYLVDFSGHGVGAAVNTFRLHTMMSEMPPLNSPAALLSELNRHLVDLIPRGQFATMLYAIVDIRAHSITYSSAAAPSPVIGHAKSDEVILAESQGMPLGISAKANYTDRRLDFPPGAYLFLYSDALIEARVPAGQMFGTDGLLSLLNRPCEPGRSGHIPAILNQFKARACLPLEDDLTAVWLQR